MSQKQLIQDSIDHHDYPIEEGVIIDSLDIRLQEIIKRSILILLVVPLLAIRI